MVSRLDDILGDGSADDLAAEPEQDEQHWLDKVRHSVDTLGVHAWADHIVAAGCNDGRSVKDCADTVHATIIEVI